MRKHSDAMKGDDTEGFSLEKQGTQLHYIALACMCKTLGLIPKIKKTEATKGFKRFKIRTCIYINSHSHFSEKPCPSLLSVVIIKH